MSRNLPSLAVLLLLAGCLVPRPASAADAATPVAKLIGPSGEAVYFSHDGSRIVTSSSESVHIWDATTFKPARNPITPKSLFVIRVADRANVLLTMAKEQRLWDLRTGDPIGTPVGPPEDEDLPFTAAVGADGTLVAFDRAVATADGGIEVVVEVWQVSPRRLVRSLPQQRESRYVLLSPDGRYLITAFGTQGMHVGEHVFRLWNVMSGKEVRPPVTTGYNYHPMYGPPAAFSPDGRRLALLSGGNFILFDTATGKELGKSTQPDRRGSPGRQMWSVSFSADGRRILAQGSGLVDVWDATTVARVGHTLEGWDARLNPDGTKVAGVFLSDPFDPDWGGERTQLVIRDTTTGQLLEVLARQRANCVAWSPDGRRVAAGFASDGYTAVWEVPEGGKP